MPHLKILVSAIVGDRVYETGEEIPDASDALAATLIEDGNAEEVDPNAPDAASIAAAEATKAAEAEHAAAVKKAIAAAKKAAGAEKADAVEKAIASAFGKTGATA